MHDLFDLLFKRIKAHFVIAKKEILLDRHYSY